MFILRKGVVLIARIILVTRIARITSKKDFNSKVVGIITRRACTTLVTLLTHRTKIIDGVGRFTTRISYRT